MVTRIIRDRHDNNTTYTVYIILLFPDCDKLENSQSGFFLSI